MAERERPKLLAVSKEIEAWSVLLLENLAAQQKKPLSKLSHRRLPPSASLNAVYCLQ
jgi:hypothetical protein